MLIGPANGALPISPSISVPIVHVCSEHPLVQRTLIEILRADHSCVFNPCPAPRIPARVDDGITSVVVIDIASVSRWNELLSGWIACGARPIALLLRDGSEFKDQTRLLTLGVCGIIVVSDNFDNELPEAIIAVTEGNLWVGQQVLQEYVKQTKVLLTKRSEFQLFTAREEQVIGFLLRGFAYKEIGSFLGVSERTVKFHISNILKKAKVKSRREFLQLTMTRQPVFMAGG